MRLPQNGKPDREGLGGQRQLRLRKYGVKIYWQMQIKKLDMILKTYMLL